MEKVIHVCVHYTMFICILININVEYQTGKIVLCINVTEKDLEDL